MIYVGLPHISTVIAQRTVRIAGHCTRAQDEIISTILPLRLQQLVSRGMHPLTFLDIVVKLTVEDMRVAILDSSVWRCHFMESRWMPSTNVKIMYVKIK